MGIINEMNKRRFFLTMVSNNWFNYAKLKILFEIHLEIMNYYITFAPYD